jgi:hypothetical protein
MKVLAVDTDARGSMALIDSLALTLVVYPTPTLKETLSSGKSQLRTDFPVLAAILIDLTSHADVAFLEHQWSRPMQGVASTFGFGRTYGEYRGCVASGFIAKGKSPSEVNELIRLSPGMEWKGKMRLSSDKKEARAMASKLFPMCAHAWKGKDSAAEASLLAFYGLSVMGEKIPFGARFEPSVIEYTPHAVALT